MSSPSLLSTGLIFVDPNPPPHPQTQHTTHDTQNTHTTHSPSPPFFYWYILSGGSCFALGSGNRYMSGSYYRQFFTTPRAEQSSQVSARRSAIRLSLFVPAIVITAPRLSMMVPAWTGNDVHDGTKPNHHGHNFLPMMVPPWTKTAFLRVPYFLSGEAGVATSIFHPHPICVVVRSVQPLIL